MNETMKLIIKSIKDISAEASCKAAVRNRVANNNT